MSKRRRHTRRITDPIRAEVVEFRKTLIGKSLDELLEERQRLGRMIAPACAEINRLRIMSDIVRDAIEAKRMDPDDFGVSEHAVLRYLQRVKGLDVRAVKAEIRAYARKFEDPEALNQIVMTPDELKIALSDSGVVTTVWAEAEPGGQQS